MKREAIFFVVFPAIVLSLMSTYPLTRTQAATFTVNSTSDNADANVGDGNCADLLGNCTLRAAIQEANVNANVDTIAFNIAGAGVKIISVAPLPVISQPTRIDGWTQGGAGYTGPPLIEITRGNLLANYSGLVITAGGSDLRGLVINRFGAAQTNGIELLTIGGNTIKGCYIGTDATGTADLGNSLAGIFIDSANNIIGGTDPTERNIISGNSGNGITISGAGATGNQVMGNFIGTDVTGTADLGNLSGVEIVNALNNTIGGNIPAERNVISANNDYGVKMSGGATDNQVRGNFIGTDASGAADLGNTDGGVFLNASSSNTIGGASSATGNTIAFNGIGVLVSSGTGNAIRANSIFSNDTLGIDLGNIGVTQNDATDGDTGANNLQNFPVLFAAYNQGGNTHVQGSLNSTPNTQFVVEFFSNSTCDSSGNGEGQTRIDATTVTTDVNGDVSFNVTTPSPVATGQFITATATRSVAPLDTSEFSGCAQITDPLIVTNTNNSGAGSFRQAILDANATPGLSQIRFDIPGAGVQSIATTPLALPSITEPVIIDGASQPGYAGSPLIELNGGNLGVNGLNISGGNSKIRGLVINSFTGDGIVLNFGGNNTIEGCYIGTDATGTIDMGNTRGISVSDPGNLIGGFSSAERNIISGNNTGIATFGGATGTQIMRNFIGTDVTGTAAMGNGPGVQVGGTSNVLIERNLISGNSIGISLSGATDAQVKGNLIGTAAGGTADLGNSNSGLSILSGASNNAIGSAAAGEGNTIAFNLRGIHVSESGGAPVGNSIRGNSIFSNDNLGIDLGNTPGVTPNDTDDGDSGPNSLQNFPDITSSANLGGSINIQGTLDSSANAQFTIDFYSNPSCDPSGNGEGQSYIGFTIVNTNGSGDASFNVTLDVAVPAGHRITATATDATNNTSEFSTCSVPTAIELICFVAHSSHDTASSAQNFTDLEWRTGFEVSNLGFNLYRDENGKRTRLNGELIAGSALFAGANTALTAGRSYAWRDNSPASQEAAYWLEDIDLDGSSSLYQATRSIGPEAQLLTSQFQRNSQILSEATADDLQAASSPLETRANLAATTSAGIEAHGKIASGQAVKIAVRREGWYRVSHADLTALGFDVTTDPRCLQLFVDGRAVPILVQGEDDGRFDSTDTVEFYGLGLDAQSSDIRTYWLSAGSGAGKRINKVQGRGEPSAALSFTHTIERKDRTIYFAALRNGERENFFGAVITPSGVDQLINLSNVIQETTRKAMVEVILQGVTQLQHRVTVQLNNEIIGEVGFDSQQQGIARLAVQHSLLREGSNIIRFESQNGPSDVSLVDSIRVSFQHTFKADNDSLKFAAHGKLAVTIEGFSSKSIRVFDVTNPMSPQEVVGEIKEQEADKGQQATYSVTAAPRKTGERTLLAFTTGRRPAGLSLNRESNLKEATGAQFVIITRRDFLASIEPLVRLREKRGMSVALVDVEDIYDEFSYGQKTPLAIRDFLVVADTKWKMKPSFLLMVGDASYDPKNYLGFGDTDFVPTKLVDTEYLETASDDWFSDFRGDGVARIATGRLPVRTAQDVARMVSKIFSAEGALSLATAVLVADRDEGFDFENATARLRVLTPANVQVEEIKRGELGDIAARSRLIAVLNRGPKLVNYVGHGSVNTWRGGLLTSEDAGELNNSQSLSVFVMMTCLNGYFDDPATDSLAESLLMAERGGAVAVWASSGLTYPQHQMWMNQEMYRQLLAPSVSRTEPMTIGEATMRAKSSVTDSDVRRTWILLGDPTLEIK